MTCKIRRQQTATPTFRECAGGMEKHIGVYNQILDHGFIAVKDYMGSDDAVLQMARMSYGKGTKSMADDRGLLRYLLRMSHTSPFEGCVIKLHVKLPTFVMRQWVRHRTASLNEYSARYSVVRDEFYIPEPGRIAKQSKDNKQGSGEVVNSEQAELVRQILQDACNDSYRRYQILLGDMEHGPIPKDLIGISAECRLSDMMDDGFDGIARELARINLPLSAYTEMYWQTNLHNLMHFLRLRNAPDAQYEIRVYAEKILEIMEDWVPVTTEAFRDYQLEGARLSRMEIELLKDLLAGRTNSGDGMSKREKKDFCARFGVDLPCE